MGLPEELLNQVNDELIIQIWNENKHSEELEFIVEHSIEYIQTGSPATPQPAGAISGSDLDLWMVCAKTISSGYIQKVNVYVYFDWEPYTTMVYFTDGIVTTWDASEWAFSSPFSCKVYGHAKDALYINNSNPTELVAGSIGAEFDIKVIYGCPYGSVTFSLTPRFPIPNGTSKTSPVYSTYAHGTIFGSVDISTSSGGLSFSGTYDHMATYANISHG